MKRITTIIPTQIPDPDAVAKLAEQGYTPDSLKTAIEQASKLAGDPAASKDDAASAKAMVDALTAMLPPQIDHDHEDIQIVYEAKDRVYLGLGGGLFGATVLFQDGANYVVELDNEPGVSRTFPPETIIKQADSGGEGKITHVDPIKTGWAKFPVNPYIVLFNAKGEPYHAPALKSGQSVRGCFDCQTVLSPDDEKAKRCPSCKRDLTGVHIVGMEAL